MLIQIVESGSGTDGDEYRNEAVFASLEAAEAWAVAQDREYFHGSARFTWEDHVRFSHDPKSGEFGHFQVTEWEVRS